MTGRRSLWLAALWFALTAAAPPPDTANGYWLTETHHGIVHIMPCSASICGVLVTSDLLARTPDLTDHRNANPALRGRKLLGLTLLSGFHAVPTGWAGGTIYNPDDGDTYHARLTIIDANHLRVRGCVFVPLCRSQVWVRVAAPAHQG
jgi:uncharacterized protein (DUF2147 family)